MQITTEYTLTPDEALRGTRAFKRFWYRLSVGAGLFLIFLGWLSHTTPLGQQGFGRFMLLNGLLFVVLPEAVLRWARLRRGADAYAPVELTLHDEGLALRTDGTEGGLPWTAFKKVQRHSGFWLFRISRSQAVLIPERVLDAQATAELSALLTARKLLKA